MRVVVAVIFPSVLLFGLVACYPIFIPVSPSPTITTKHPIVTSTPTIVWFPPTSTNTPLPTATLSITPTLDTRPEYGNLIFTDNFLDSSFWTVSQTAIGRIVTGKQELCLAIDQPQGYLYSLRRDTQLDDYYLEITASPSLCRGDDEYGLLLRVSPSLDFYRFGLTCNGKVRVDRILNGVASSSTPPTLSGAVPPGAPSSSRIAVWAQSEDILFYVNGEYLFSIRDTVLLKGGLGLYARAAGEEAMTVNFSDLAIYLTNKQ